MHNSEVIQANLEYLNVQLDIPSLKLSSDGEHYFLLVGEGAGEHHGLILRHYKVNQECFYERVGYATSRYSATKRRDYDSSDESNDETQRTGKQLGIGLQFWTTVGEQRELMIL